jgi:hypothetical protein
MRSPAIVAEVRAYLRRGQRVFVDTGAFGIFKIQECARAAGQPAPAGIDFDAILGLYDQLLADLPSDARARLALVMPDCVGDQDGTLALLARYREKVSAYIADGVDVIVAVQSGQRPAQHALVETVRILGTDAFRAGVPSRAAAMSDRELGSLRHRRFHLLGQAAPTKSLHRRAFLLVHGNGLAVDITADANVLRAHYHRIAAGQRARCAQIGTTLAFGEIVDDTELIADIVDGTRWLSGAELRALRMVIECLFGPQPESAWKRVQRTDSLGDYLGERYGENATEAFVDHLYRAGLQGIFETRARGVVSQQARIAQVRNTALAIAERFAA